ncbi:MAG: inositol monophosphatase family protein, partial [Faecousia sp.]
MNESLYRAVTQAVREAGALLSRRELAAQVSQKGKTDFVTEVDRSVQELLKERLAALTPDVPLMSEEQDNSGLDLTGPVWILDPVDGTTNLIHDFRHSAISLALADGGALRFGIVYNPFHSELFSAAAGAGAFCNGTPIRVRAVAALRDALCSVGTNPGQRQ